MWRVIRKTVGTLVTVILSTNVGAVSPFTFIQQPSGIEVHVKVILNDLTSFADLLTNFDPNLGGGSPDFGQPVYEASLKFGYSGGWAAVPLVKDSANRDGATGLAESPDAVSKAFGVDFEISPQRVFAAGDELVNFNLNRPTSVAGNVDFLFLKLNPVGTVNADDVGAPLGSFSVPVPEPHTYALFLAGLGLLGLVARRRRR